MTCKPITVWNFCHFIDVITAVLNARSVQPAHHLRQASWRSWAVGGALRGGCEHLW